MSCGNWAMIHIPSGDLSRWFCGSGTCPRPECRKKFFHARVRLLSALVEEHRLIRFFTLTLDRDMIPLDRSTYEYVDAWDYIHHPWSKFRKRMNRRHAGFKYVAILEAHKNNKYPHIHGFTDVWQSQQEWSSLWEQSHGGKVVWIEQVRDDGVSEYVSKSLEVCRYVGKENLLDAYKQRRNHRTLWRSENLKAKFELTISLDWDIIKQMVYREDGSMTDYYGQKGIWQCQQKETVKEKLGDNMQLPI